MIIHEILGLSIITVAALTVLISAELLKRSTKLPTELTRKFAHVGSGMAVLTIPLVIDSHWTVLILSVSFAGLMAGTHLTGLLGSVHGVGRGVGGVLWYPFTAWLTYLLVFDVMEAGFILYAIPILVLAMADAMGAIVGKSYGRHSYEVMDQHHRTLEGSAAVFGMALICIHIPLLVSGIAGRTETLLISICVALAAAMLETVSVYGLDNLLVPFGTLFMLVHLLPMSTDEILLQLALLASCAVGTVIVSWRKCSTAGGTVSLLLAGFAIWTTGGARWIVPFAGLMATFMVYERLSPVASRHTKSRYALGTAVSGLAIPAALAIAHEIVTGADLQRALYQAFIAALACDAAVIFFMLPQNHTFRIKRLRRSMATKDLWQYTPTLGKTCFAIVGAAVPVTLALTFDHRDLLASSMPAVWGMFGLVAFVIVASVMRSSQHMCPACGSVTLRGLYCCTDNRIGEPTTRSSAMSLSFRETFLAANTIAAVAAAGAVLWLGN